MLNKLIYNIKPILLLTTLAMSLFSFVYFYTHGHLNLDYGDAVSRLNISRKIVDNLTPGLGQIGAVWLPLPLILMLPFIWNNFLWQTGLAGYFISGISFIVTVYSLYKLGVLAFNSKLSGLVMALIAMTSLNLLYIQTTAMSESIFIATVTLSTYFLFKWAKDRHMASLLYAAIFISACTFIRYEGYLVLMLSFALVFLISLIHHKKIRKTEGDLVLFGTLAITGVIAWMIYNWAIFGNPLYWKEIYTNQANIISSEVLISAPVSAAKHSFSLSKVFNSIYQYWSSTAQMNGIILTVLSTILGVFFFGWLVYKKNFLRKPQYLTLFLPLGVFAFVVYAVYGGFPLTQPDLTLVNLLTKKTNDIGEYNIRYGLNMLPFVLIPIGWALSLSKPIKIFVLSVVALQFVTVFLTPVYSYYSLPHNLTSAQSSMHTGINPASIWLKKNYDKGLIMISAQNHNPTMFFLGLDYKNYIHEGAGKYWLESTVEPQKYATWLFLYKPPEDATKTDDLVSKYVSIHLDEVNQHFDQVFNDGRYLIYKKKVIN